MVKMETDACATRAASASAGTQPLTGTVATPSATDIILFNRDIALTKTTFPSSLPPHTPSPPFSAPSSSSKSSESHTHTLSRTSSVSSLISSCSATTSTSATSDDDEDDDSSSGVYLVSILKKPRQPRGKQRDQQQRQQHRNRSNLHTSHGSDSDSDSDGDDDHDTEVEVEEEDDEDDEVDWEDEDSECDIIFERNVTFDDPLAIDIITGAPVPPSTRSRLEWTAMRARACLERGKTKLEGAWAGLQEDDEEDAQDAQKQGTEKRSMSLCKTLDEELQDAERFKIEDMEWEEEDDEDLSEWLSRATLRDNSKHTPECSDREEMEGWAAEVEDLTLDITETVVGAASQR